MRGVGGRARVRELPVARVSLVGRRREPSVARGQVRAADGNLARSPGKKAPDAPPTLEDASSDPLILIHSEKPVEKRQ